MKYVFRTFLRFTIIKHKNHDQNIELLHKIHRNKIPVLNVSGTDGIWIFLVPVDSNAK